MLKNTNHDVMTGAEQSSHLSSRVMVVDGQSALVGVKSTNSATMVLGSQSFGVPFGRHPVATLKFFAPSFEATFVRVFVGVYSLFALLGATIFTLVGRVFGPQSRLFFWGSHIRVSNVTAYGCQAITP